MSFFKPVILAALAISLTACGFHLRQSYNLPEEIQTLSVTSFDPYGNLTREMKYSLTQYGITLTEPASKVANLNLKGESYSENTLSLYQNATVAQRQFSYRVQYSVTVPEKGSYNFAATISRSYLNNPLSALAKSVEEEMLTQEMRIEATKQIMRQLARLTAHIEAFDKKQAEEALLNESYLSKSDNEQINVEIRYQGKE